MGRSILEEFGLSPDVAESIWPGPEDLGESIKHNNANIDDPKLRIQFESAVIGTIVDRRSNKETNPRNLETIEKVLGKHGATLTINKEV